MYQGILIDCFSSQMADGKQIFIMKQRILKLWLEVLAHCVKEKAGLAPGSIYLIPFNLVVQK
jgi:hypothetical protein